MWDFLAFAAQKMTEGKKVALVTVTEINGSSPASPGQMIAVLADGSSAGTIGGGASEYRIVQQAVAAIHNGDRIFSFAVDHAEDGMICGGGMAGFGNVLGLQANLCIFGGGNIAQSLAQIAVCSGFSVTVVDSRPELAALFTKAKYVVCEPHEYAKNNPAADSDYAVICTPGHTSDGEAVRYCLTKKLKYLGMIGSAKKVSALLDSLRAEGFAQESLDRLYAPIGLDVADAVPGEIAVAILAEILLIKNKGTLRHKKLLT